jgi:hypothetical protein
MEFSVPSLWLLLNILQVENQAENSPGGLSLGAFAIAAGLSAKAVAPDRHVSGAVAADLELPVDLSINLPKGKVAARCQPELTQVGGLYG